MTTRTKIIKRHVRGLERLFEAEVSAALMGGCRLIQSRANVFEELRDMGLAERISETVDSYQSCEMVVSGWSLTHAGRFAYCSRFGEALT